MIRIATTAVLSGVFALAGTFALAADDAPEVVASIKPIHSLVAGVMAGTGEPHLLLKGGQSPHSYSLRPSDAAALQQADVVFWVGDLLETFLEKPLEALSHDARVVALETAPGLTLLSYRESDEADPDHTAGEGHAGDEEGHTGHDHRHDHGDDHAHTGVDPHIWLSPANAAALVEHIAATLSEADPANRERYHENSDAVRARLASLEATLEEELAPVRGLPYVVFHDAYQYFEQRYGLSPVAWVTVSPERPPGAAKVAELRETIRESGARCVFREPQFEPSLVRTITEGTNARAGVLDPLGADITAGPDAYFTLLETLADSFQACLAPGS